MSDRKTELPPNVGALTDALIDADTINLGPCWKSAPRDIEGNIVQRRRG